MEIATMRRLRDELNFETSLEYVYQFCYTAAFGEVGSENELCHVYLGRVIGEVQANESEIASLRFVSRQELNAELSANAADFTPWFKQEWRELSRQHREQLARYCDAT